MRIYVVYLTIYRGNLLPPFYIGSTNSDRIRRGYVGSVSSKEYKDIWKNETTTNHDLFSIKVLSEHPTRAAALKREQDLHRRLNVVANPLYINKAVAGIHPRNGRPMSEKTRAALRKANVGRKHTEATRAKMVAARQQRGPISEETREKLRMKSGRKRAPIAEETKLKISAKTKGRKKGPMSDETRKKLSESKKAYYAVIRAQQLVDGTA